MQEDFQKVRAACDFAGVLESAAQVTVIDGRMQARNAVLTISVPTDLPDLAVPAVDLDFALRKVGECAASVGEMFVTLKSKAGSTRIKQLGARPAFKKPEVQTHAVPKGLCDTLQEIYPFTTGDREKVWSVGARLDDHLVTTTNSIMIVQGELPEPTGFEGLTLPRPAIAYMIKRRKDLVAWGLGTKHIMLEFEDGGWCAVSRMTTETPDQVRDMIASMGDSWEDMQEITDEYRAAFLASVDHTEELLEVHEDHIYGARLASEHKCPVQTKLGELQPALFTAKDLTTVLSVATSIGFDRYPKPVPFLTKRGTKGLIAGRRKQGA